MYVTVNTMPTNEEIDALPRVSGRPAGDRPGRADRGGFGGALAGKTVCPRAGAAHVHPGGHRQLGRGRAAAYELGAKRVVLARELTLEEIAGIRAKAPAGLEIEAFVHGAMCMSVSGRCLLSNYMTGRDGNRGPVRPALPVEVRPGGRKSAPASTLRSARMKRAAISSAPRTSVRPLFSAGWPPPGWTASRSRAGPRAFTMWPA